MKTSGGRSWRLGLLTTLLALCGTPAPAQEPAGPDPTPLDDVVVVGRRLEEQVRSFVDELVDPPADRGPARWSRRGGVCVGVANLTPVAARAIADRVSEIADGIGLAVGDPGCRPNVLIIATDDAPGVTAALVERSPNAFRPQYAGSSKSQLELERFVMTDRPVRWWHVSMPVIAGRGMPAVRMPGDDPDKPISVPGEGRFGTGVRNVLLRAFVIVDLDQVESLNLRQLADYVAMAAFSQIDPDARTAGYSTILNVLADPDATGELTPWDRAYLSGVYQGDRNQRGLRAQTDGVAAGMLRAARSDAQDDAPD